MINTGTSKKPLKKGGVTKELCRFRFEKYQTR